ncbi:nitroreductase family protein [Tumebacillus avium]|nr:nitroreductase family protein [Tumebacillus avium]
MHNRDLAIGRSFWLQTGYLRYDTMRDLERRTEPELFLTASPYLGRVSLSLAPVRPLGSVEPLQQVRSGAALTPLERLTTLLYLTLGLVRYEAGSVRPFHRGAPSPRCLYATELYVVPPQGVFRYDPLMHALEQRSEEGMWDVLEQALGITLYGAESVLIVAADVWRIARLYADFAYNIATLEAGHALGQLQVLASRLGYEARIHEHFLDRPVLESLGLNGKVQTPLAVVVLWPQGAVKQERVSCESVPRQPVAADTRFEQEMNQCGDLQKMMEASRLTFAEELPEAEQAQEHLVRTTADFAGSAAGCEADLLDVIKTRNSGNDKIGLSATGRPIPLEQLSGLLQALAAFPDAQGLAREIGLYLSAHRVAGLASGIYRCELSAPDFEAQSLHQDMGLLMEQASVVDGKYINFRSIPAAFYLTVDFERTLHQHGNRGYQIMQMRAGRLTQYLCLLAAARGWYARPLKSYRDAETEALLGLSQTTRTVVYQLVIGESDTPYLEFDMGL